MQPAPPNYGPLRRPVNGPSTEARQRRRCPLSLPHQGRAAAAPAISRTESTPSPGQQTARGEKNVLPVLEEDARGEENEQSVVGNDTGIQRCVIMSITRRRLPERSPLGERGSMDRSDGYTGNVRLGHRAPGVVGGPGGASQAGEGGEDSGAIWSLRGEEIEALGKGTAQDPRRSTARAPTSIVEDGFA